MQVHHTSVDHHRDSRIAAGYTLVEVLCSVFIAAIMVTVLFVGFDNGFAILRTTREDLRATQILLQKTEAVRLLTWQQLSNCPATFQEYYIPGAAATNSGTLYWGTISTTAEATNIPNSVPYKADLHLITVTVQWTNSIGSQQVPHFRQMQTLSARNGMQNYLFGGSVTNN